MSVYSDVEIAPRLANEQQLQELIRLGIATYFQKFNLPISKTKLLEILYMVDDKLSGNNPLKNAIPFYWYTPGPYSQPVMDQIDKLEHAKILSKHEYGFSASQDIIVPHDEYFQEFSEKLNEIISQISINPNKIIKEFYESKAPYRFYTSYKHTFRTQLDNYFKDKHTKYTPQDLRLLLNKAIGDLPSRYFGLFKYAYCDFVDIISELVKLDLSESSQTFIKDRIWNVFETFAKGVRILDHHSFYDSYAKQWEIDFENSVINMEKNIDELFLEYEKITKTKSNLITISDLICIVLDRRSKDQLEMISFYPSKHIPDTNNGRIDAALFGSLDDSKFTLLLNKFENSHNAALYYIENNEFKSIVYRLMES